MRGPTVNYPDADKKRYVRVCLRSTRRLKQGGRLKVPALNLSGRYLRLAGFEVGEYAIVSSPRRGMLLVTLAPLNFKPRVKRVAKVPKPRTEPKVEVKPWEK